MAVYFGGATTDKIDYGPLTSVGTPAQVTMCTWCRIESAVDNKRICQKGTGAAEAYFVQTSSDLIRCVLDGTGASAQVDAALTAFTAYALNRPIFIAAWNNFGVGADVYMGNLTQLAAPPTSYSAQSAGTAPQVTWGGGISLGVGSTAAGVRNFPGSIAFFGLWPRVLTLTEIHTVQRMFLPGTRRISPNVVPGSVLWTLPGLTGISSLQRDYSGLSNHGTVTGSAEVTIPGLTIQEPPWMAVPRKRLLVQV